MVIRTRTNTFNAVDNTFNGGHGTNTRRNAARVDLRNRLKAPLAETVRLVPSKQLAQETGISWRTLEAYRTGLGLCDLPEALLISRALPDSPLAQEMRSFLLISGEVDSDTAVITEIVREVITKTKGTR